MLNGSLYGSVLENGQEILSNYSDDLRKNLGMTTDTHVLIINPYGEIRSLGYSTLTGKRPSLKDLEKHTFAFDRNTLFREQLPQIGEKIEAMCFKSDNDRTGERLLHSQGIDTQYLPNKIITFRLNKAAPREFQDEVFAAHRRSAQYREDILRGI